MDIGTLGCRHLLSNDPEGIEIKTYCAIIPCMLIRMWTGKNPTLRTYEMICFDFCGIASEDALLTIVTPQNSQIPTKTRRRKTKENNLLATAAIVPNSIGAFPIFDHGSAFIRPQTMKANLRLKPQIAVKSTTEDAS